MLKCINIFSCACTCKIASAVLYMCMSYKEQDLNT